MNNIEKEFEELLAELERIQPPIPKKKTEKKPNLHKDHRKRVKKRFLDYGLESFTEHQVLEAALFYALPHVDTNEIAHELINLAGSFTKVFDLSLEELMSVKGIKENAATFIKFLYMFSKYYAEKCAIDAMRPGLNYHQIADIFVKSLIGEKRETLMACYFDENMNLIEKKILNKGTLTDVSLGYRDLIDDIYKYHVKYIAIGHNHPIYSPTPSTDDVSNTQSLQAFLKKMQVEFIEHYVVTGNQYIGVVKHWEFRQTSFKD